MSIKFMRAYQEVSGDLVVKKSSFGCEGLFYMNMQSGIRVYAYT